MRARLVNEKFKEESDPVKDMGIGYTPRQLNSKTFKVLDFIKSKGEEGASFTEIQYYIWTVLNGNDSEEFWQKSKVDTWDYNLNRRGTTKYIRKTRGYWTTQLFGSPGNHEGLLHMCCKKNPETKKWVFVKYPGAGGKPIYTKTRSYF